MHVHQYAIIFIIFLLCFLKPSRAGALILLVYYFLYSVLIFADVPASNYLPYFSITATLCLLAGLALHRVNNCAAFCSYLLAAMCLYGAHQWFNYLPKERYDVICGVISFIQLIAIAPKGFINGLYNKRSTSGVIPVRDID